MSVRARDDRVILRDFEPTDIDTFFDWMLPDNEWHDWDGPYFPKPAVRDVENDRARMHENVRAGLPLFTEPSYTDSGSEQADDPASTKAHSDPPPGRLVIAGANDPARLLGIVTWYWESEATSWPRMGIAVWDPAVRGTGVGTAALKLWTSHLFGHPHFRARDVVRLDYATWSGNSPMLAVGKKLGFTEEARFRQARIVNGALYDSVVMGVLRSEWSFPVELRM